MTSLTEARWNYFWPDLHRAVVSLLRGDGLAPTENDLTRFFRRVLNATDGSRLSQLANQGVHHNYLALIFEQAGIGKDRNRIITGFLERLVGTRLDATSQSAEEAVEQALHEYVRSQSAEVRDDAALLAPTLTDIGLQLLRVVAAIRSDPRRVDLANRTWPDLRTWWLEFSGADLDALTPSAQTVLSGWVRKLSTVWTRADVLRLVRSGRVGCRWPDGSSTDARQSHVDLPIGHAELETADGPESVLIVPYPGSDISELMALPWDTWTTIDGDFRCKISAHPFRERHAAVGSVVSVPVFASQAVPEPRAYFWGNRLRSGTAFPHAAPTGRLLIPATFKWRGSRLLLRLETIHANFEDSDGYAFELGGTVFWTGSVRKSTLSGWVSRHFEVGRLLASGQTAIRASLLKGGATVAQTTIRAWPLEEHGFVVCGTVACRPGRPIVRWAESSDSTRRILLVAPGPIGELKTENLRELSRRELDVHGRLHTEVAFELAAGRRAWIRHADHFWSLELKARIGLSYLSDDEIVRAGVAFTAAGNVRLVDQPSGMRLRCSRALDLQGIDAGLGVWLEQDGNREFGVLSDDHVLSLQGESVLDLSKFATDRRLALRNGGVMIQLGTPSGADPVIRNLFLPPEQVEVPPTRLGSKPRLALDLGGRPHVVEAEHIAATISDRATALVSGADYQVAIRWLPNIFDLVLGGVVGAECNYRFSLTRGNFDRGEALPCVVRSSSQCFAEVTFLNESVRLGSGVEHDLLPLIRSRMIPRGLLSAPLLTTAGGESIEWTVVATPRVSHVRVEVASEHDAVVRALLKFDVDSLFPCELEVVVRAEGTGECRTRLLTRPDFALDASISFAARRASDDTCSVALEVECAGTVIHAEVLALPARSPALARTLNPRDAINDYKQTRAIEFLPVIYFAVLDFVRQSRGARKASDLIPALGVGAHPEAEQLLAATFRTIDAAGCSSSKYVHLPQLTGAPTAVRVLAAGGWLLLSGRYASRGILVPDEFAEAVDALAEREGDPTGDRRVDHFVKLTYAYAHHVARANGIAGTREMPVIPLGAEDELSSSGMASLLVGASLEFAAWMEAACEQEKQQG